jgi:hypothetical protein
MISTDQQAYQRLYDIWQSDALNLGDGGRPGGPGSPRGPNGVVYGQNFRTLDVLSSLDVATTDTGTNVQKSFFNPSTTDRGNPLLNTVAPSFKEGGNVPAGSFYGLAGVIVDFPLNVLATMTITQLIAIMNGAGGAGEGLVGSKLAMNFGAQTPFLDVMASRFLRSTQGWEVSNDAAAVPLVARKGISEGVEMMWLPRPKGLVGGVQISSTFNYTLASIPVAFKLLLKMHFFAADQGNPT